MAEIYSGIINLSKIPADRIRTNNKGEKIIYCDFAERKTPGQYGDTHYLKIWDGATRTSVYIGDFRPAHFGDQEQQRESAYPPEAPAKPAPVKRSEPETLDPQPDDLPW